MAFRQGGRRGAQVDAHAAVLAVPAPEAHCVIQVGGEVDGAVLDHAAIDQTHGGHDIAEPGQMAPALGILDAAQPDADQRLQQLIAARHTPFELGDP